MQHYFRFNTTNPPDDVTEAADFLQKILEREGIPVTRYEAAPGKINLAARLKGSGKAKPILLLHHTYGCGSRRYESMGYNRSL